MKQFKILRDPTDVPSYGVELTDAGYRAYLAAGVDTAVAVPAGGRLALISASDHFYAGSAAITLPVLGAGFSAAAAVEHNPQVIVLTGETALHLISRVSCDVSVSFWG